MENSNEIIELLRAIKINTRPKSGFDIVLSAKTTTIKNTFSPSIQLNGSYGIALDFISTYNSLMNVTTDNNEFHYHNGTTWKAIKLGVGAYEIDEINSEIGRLMKVNKDYDTVNDVSYIAIGANRSRLTSIIEIATGYQVDIGGRNTLGPLLGFTSKVLLAAGYHESPNPVDIIKVNSIVINCDVVKSSYINGVKSNHIYSFPVNVTPGFRMTSHPSTLQFHRLAVDQLDTITIWLTDDNGKPLDLRGELVTIRLRVQEL